MVKPMRCHIRLTWNGTTVLDGRATRVVASEIVRSHFLGNFAGLAFKRWTVESGFKPSDLINGADSLSYAFADDTGAASAEVVADRGWLFRRARDGAERTVWAPDWIDAANLLAAETPDPLGPFAYVREAAPQC